MFEMDCPNCRHRFRGADREAGQMVHCPNCLSRFRAPEIEGPYDPSDEEDRDDVPRSRRRPKLRKVKKDRSWRIAHTRAFIGGIIAFGLGALITALGLSMRESRLSARVIGIGLVFVLAGLAFLGVAFFGRGD